MGARFNRWWLLLWTVNTAAMGGLLLARIRPLHFVFAAVPLFLVPEAIGLRRRGDSLPPLTYAVRRYVPRWLVSPSIFALAAYAAISWWGSPYRTLVECADAFCAAWLMNHFDVTYDGPGE